MVCEYRRFICEKIDNKKYVATTSFPTAKVVKKVILTYDILDTCLMMVIISYEIYDSPGHYI